MNFVSMSFFAFLIVIIFLLSKTNEIKRQRYILLIFSLLFYSWWDIRFSGLLIFTIMIAYIFALKIWYSKQKRRYCIVGISILLSILFYFKYYNFFMESFNRIFSFDNKTGLDIVLPIGISFYIFQAISYIMDVYFGQVIPTRDFSKLALYISFFPQLVAGPIVRSKDFLEQLEEVHRIEKDNLLSGIQIFLFGIVKKIVIADRLAICVDAVFAAPSQYSAFSLIGAIIAYSMQIYCDFSGYSDMAIGIAQMLGYKLCVNFNLPYLSRNPSEFWRRWHISLSSWLRDYIYIPLGGNRKGKARQYFNLCFTMLLGGLWHGANWTFIVWGGVHGIALVMHKIYLLKRKHCKTANRSGGFLSIIGMYIFVCIGWIFFRAENIQIALIILKRIIMCANGINYIYTYTMIYGAVLLGIHLLIGIRNRGEGTYLILDLRKFGSRFFFFLEVFLTILVCYLGSTAFIYFQF